MQVVSHNNNKKYVCIRAQKVYMGMCSIIFYGKQAKKDGRHYVLVEQKCTSFSGLKEKLLKRERKKSERDEDEEGGKKT